MHPPAFRTVRRSAAALAAATIALLLSSCGDDSFFRSSTTASSVPDIAATSTPIVSSGGGTIVADYAQAVLARKVSKAAAPATAAALYLDYLARGDAIGANVDFEEVRQTADGFELQIGDVNYNFGNVRVSPSGVEDVTLNGVPLSQRLAGVGEPVKRDGLRINSGVSYVTALDHRIVILTVVNRAGVDLQPVPSQSLFQQRDGVTMPHLGTLPRPGKIAAGSRADVAFISEAGDQQPDGLLTYAFRGDDGRIIDIPVPLGKASQSFFQVGEDGTITGALHSDVGFANGSAVLSAEAQNILAAAARELLSIAGAETAICAVGHADSVGTKDDNLALSTQRAAAVRDELLRVGVPNEIGVAGHGERFAPGDELPDPNSRRVDIRLERCPA